MLLGGVPNKAMLRMATRSGKLFWEAREEEPNAMSMPKVWVKLWGVPSKQHRADRLMAATTMIGRPHRGRRAFPDPDGPGADAVCLPLP